ncbi:MAG: DUF4340 domain-containing protein [Ruminococcaceae bacterium]|nr:DUF4340 domain-containing protein [Oscillospiraceae bacterium]
MTWKERRLISLLSAVLGLLMAVLLIVLGIRYRENRPEPMPAPNPETGETAVQEQGSYFSALTYYNGVTTLSFSLDDKGRWIWSDDPSFPLNDTVVLSILSVLSSWAPQEILTDAESVQAADWTHPIGSLTATTSEGTVVRLLFGRPTEDGSAHYVRVNNDGTAVHVISAAVYDLLCVPIYDMMVLPELPELPEACIDSIQVSHAATGDTETQTPQGILFTAYHMGDTVTWRYGGADITEDPLLRALLYDLKTLSPLKCKIYRPSPEAVTICGYDAPTATVQVTYTDGSDIQTLQLTVGNALPDGSGHYVWLNDDTTIYTLAPSALDTILKLSANGLAGSESPEA